MQSVLTITQRPRIVVWFSCGDASAVTVKLVQAQYGATHDIAIARCVIAEEHEDNDRFAADCETWFGAAVLNLNSAEYASCEAVWMKRRYLSGVNGASCTIEMKKAVRWAFEKIWQPDLQAFGYTAEERDRACRFREQNPDVRLITPLIDAGLSKGDCHAMVARAGIELPMMYRLGYDNNNCIGCVKAQGVRYWQRTRRLFPDVFERRAALSRELGVRIVKLGGGDRERLFLDELPEDLDDDTPEPTFDCSLLCYLAETKMKGEA